MHASRLLAHVPFPHAASGHVLDPHQSICVEPHRLGLGLALLSLLPPSTFLLVLLIDQAELLLLLLFAFPLKVLKVASIEVVRRRVPSGLARPMRSVVLVKQIWRLFTALD